MLLCVWIMFYFIFTTAAQQNFTNKRIRNSNLQTINKTPYNNIRTEKRYKNRKLNPFGARRRQMGLRRNIEQEGIDKGTIIYQTAEKNLQKVTNNVFIEIGTVKPFIPIFRSGLTRNTRQRIKYTKRIIRTSSVKELTTDAINSNIDDQVLYKVEQLANELNHMKLQVNNDTRTIEDLKSKIMEKDTQIVELNVNNKQNSAFNSIKLIENKVSVSQSNVIDRRIFKKNITSISQNQQNDVANNTIKENTITDSIQQENIRNTNLNDTEDKYPDIVELYDNYVPGKGLPGPRVNETTSKAVKETKDYASIDKLKELQLNLSRLLLEKTRTTLPLMKKVQDFQNFRKREGLMNIAGDKFSVNYDGELIPNDKKADNDIPTAIASREIQNKLNQERIDRSIDWKNFNVNTFLSQLSSEVKERAQMNNKQVDYTDIPFSGRRMAGRFDNTSYMDNVKHDDDATNDLYAPAPPNDRVLILSTNTPDKILPDTEEYGNFNPQDTNEAANFERNPKYGQNFIKDDGENFENAEVTDNVERNQWRPLAPEAGKQKLVHDSTEALIKNAIGRINLGRTSLPFGLDFDVYKQKWHRDGGKERDKLHKQVAEKMKSKLSGRRSMDPVENYDLSHEILRDPFLNDSYI